MKKSLVCVSFLFQSALSMDVPTIKASLVACDVFAIVCDAAIDCKINDEIVRHPAWQDRLEQHAKIGGNKLAWMVPASVVMSSACMSQGQLGYAAMFTSLTFINLNKRREELQTTLNDLHNNE